MNIAVVGTGIMGKSYLGAIKSIEGVNLAAICDINEELGKNLAKEYDTLFFSDYKEMAEKCHLDAVVVNLPHFLHKESAIYFLNKGLHVLMEKPMANTVEECEEMIEVAKRNNKKLAVGHIQRFFSSNIKMKEIIKEEKLGKLSMIEERRTINYFSENRPKWFLDKKASGGGIVMNYGAHAFDKFFYLCDVNDAEIVAVTDNIKTNDSIEGHAQIFAKLPCNVTATVTFCGYYSSGYEVTYYFTNGAARVIDTTILEINTNGKWERIVDKDDVEAVYTQTQEFVKYINGEQSNIASAEYGRDIINIIEKIYS